MVSPLEAAMYNASLHDVSRTWGVSPEQAARRLRSLPFVRFDHPEARGGRGRPGRRVALDFGWRWDEGDTGRPLSRLLEVFHALHSSGERFALGAPFTSALWRSFLHPQVRVFAPLETVSAWKRLFEGRVDGLQVVVEPLGDRTPLTEAEGLPVLDREAALVDVVKAWGDLPSRNLLALADALGHMPLDLGTVTSLAAESGLDRDVEMLLHHSRRKKGRLLSSEEVRHAHEAARELESLPPVPFTDLVASREAYRV